MFTNYVFVYESHLYDNVGQIVIPACEPGSKANTHKKENVYFA
jgi:hypothetical protein